MKFELPKLPYNYDDLIPYIDEQTMNIHHTKHHQGYVDKLNAALEKFPDLQEKTIEQILTDIDTVPDEIKTAVINNGGGHANHSLFWSVMTPKSNKKPTGNLLTEIESTFSGFEQFKDTFSNAANTRFGSGWAWLVVTKNKKLEIYSTPNQNSPLMEGNTPVLGLDVWEHAYYLNYQNKRPAYVENWWNLVNWEAVEDFFNNALK